MNHAPYRWSDFASGCRILEDCGLGLTPLGCYPYAIAGGIDRVFGFRRGAGNSPGRGENLRADLEIFCRRCGYFGFAWATKRPRMSPIWVRAYERVHDPKRNSDRSTQDTEAWQQSKP